MVALVIGLFQHKQPPSACARAPGDLRVAQRALRWHLRRRTPADLELAQYWLAELAFSSNGLYAWRELILAAAELAGPANACWVGGLLARLRDWNTAAAARGGGPHDPDYDMREAGPDLAGPLAATVAELHGLPKDQRADTLARLVAYATPGGLDSAEAAAPAPVVGELRDWEPVWTRMPAQVRQVLRFFVASVAAGDVGGGVHAAMLVSVWSYPDQVWLTLETYLYYAGADETTRGLVMDLQYLASLYAPTAADRPDPPCLRYWGRVRVFVATAVHLVAARPALREAPPPADAAGNFDFFRVPAWPDLPAYRPAGRAWREAAALLEPADPPAEPDPVRAQLRVLHGLAFAEGGGVRAVLRRRTGALLHGRYAEPPPPQRLVVEPAEPDVARPVDLLPGFRPGAARALPDRAYVGAAPEWLTEDDGGPVVLAGPVDARVVRRLEAAAAIAGRLGCCAVLPGRWLRTGDGSWRVLRPPWRPGEAPPPAPLLEAGGPARETLAAWALRWVLGLPVRRAATRRARPGGCLVPCDLLEAPPPAEAAPDEAVAAAARWFEANAAELAPVRFARPTIERHVDGLWPGATERWARLAEGDLQAAALLLLGNM